MPPTAKIFCRKEVRSPAVNNAEGADFFLFYRFVFSFLVYVLENIHYGEKITMPRENEKNVYFEC